MSSSIIYIKDKQEVRVSSKFIYCISVYKIWKNGASLIDEKYYACNNPLLLSKIYRIAKKKDYTLQRFVDLEGAPEDYLINKGYKIKRI